MRYKVEFEDGYTIEKDYGSQSVSVIIDDLQISKHGPILYVLIDA